MLPTEPYFEHNNINMEKYFTLYKFPVKSFFMLYYGYTYGTLERIKGGEFLFNLKLSSSFPLIILSLEYKLAPSFQST